METEGRKASRGMYRHGQRYVKWKGKGWHHLAENEQWLQAKDVMMETAEKTCGKSQYPCTGRYIETQWWNEEVADALQVKKVFIENGGKKD